MKFKDFQIRSLRLSLIVFLLAFFNLQNPNLAQYEKLVSVISTGKHLSLH